MASRSQRRAQFPQLGSDPTFYHRTDRGGAPKHLPSGSPSVGMRVDLPDYGDPATALAAAANYDLAIRSASPAARSSGESWYPRVNEAVSKGVRSHSNFLSSQPDRDLAGAGLVAAVSPNMDWERNNIDAFGEMAGMSSGQWEAIMSGTAQQAQNAVRGMSISSSPIPNLRKAGRIVQGEDPLSVIQESSAPKTNRFMRNIANPDDHGLVTVDGRAFDTLNNRALPWEQGRGISRAGNKTGKPTRYEQAEQIMTGVAEQHGLTSSAGQAVAWESVKQDVERQGGARKVGPTRVGQPIFDPQTGAPIMHDTGKFGERRTAAIRKFSR